MITVETFQLNTVLGVKHCCQQMQPGVSTFNPSKVENLGESRIAINLYKHLTNDLFKSRILNSFKYLIYPQCVPFSAHLDETNKVQQNLMTCGGLTLIPHVTWVERSAVVPSQKVFMASHNSNTERQGEQLAATFPF